MLHSQEQEEEEEKPAPAVETAQYDRGKSMRSEDPNFQQKQEERCASSQLTSRAHSLHSSLELFGLPSALVLVGGWRAAFRRVTPRNARRWPFDAPVHCPAAVVESLFRPACSKRKHKQQSDLLNRVNQETLRQGQTQEGGDAKSAGRRISEIVAYRSVDEVPATKDLKIEARLGLLLGTSTTLLAYSLLTTDCFPWAAFQSDDAFDNLSGYFVAGGHAAGGCLGAHLWRHGPLPHPYHQERYQQSGAHPADTCLISIRSGLTF